MTRTYLDTLLGIRNEWSDEIPEHEVHGKPPPGSGIRGYKVQINWFQIANTVIRAGIKENRIIDPSVIEEVEAVLPLFTSTRGFDGSHRTTPEDIARLNGLLDKVIASVK